MLKMGSGAKANSVSLGLIDSMKISAPAVNTIVFAVYMMPGPTSMRTAFRSLVARAMMSPVRVR